VKAQLKFISASCSLVLFTLAAMLPQNILAQTNYYWTTPVIHLTGGGQPQGVAIDVAGNVYIADYNKNVILRAAPEGTGWLVTTIAGSNTGNSGTNNGTGNAARFYSPSSVAVDTASNIYVADTGNNCIRKVTPSGNNWITTTIAGVANPNGGSNDGTNGVAQFSTPIGIAVDTAGNLFIGDDGNSIIRKIRPSGANWITTTIAGNNATSGYQDGTNGNAQFANPYGVAVDAADNVFVAEAGNEVIRKVSPSGTNWITTTIAGQAGTSGANDGANFDAQFNFPFAVSVDNADNVYLADYGNNVIRKLTPSGTNWIVTTIGGSAAAGTGFSNGTNDVAAFNGPQGVAVDKAGDVYVGDTYNDALRLGLLFPPFLQLSQVTNQVILSYPTALGTNHFTFILQGTTNLANNSWVTVTNIGSSSPAQWQLNGNGTPYIKLTLTNKVPDKFFRLQLP
jgi:streptogramin lyase